MRRRALTSAQCAQNLGRRALMVDAGKAAALTAAAGSGIAQAPPPKSTVWGAEG